MFLGELNKISEHVQYFSEQCENGTESDGTHRDDQDLAEGHLNKVKEKGTNENPTTGFQDEALVQSLLSS